MPGMVVIVLSMLSCVVVNLGSFAVLVKMLMKMRMGMLAVIVPRWTMEPLGGFGYFYARRRPGLKIIGIRMRQDEGRPV